MQDIQI